MASMASPPVFSRGRIFVAPRDRGGVIALDVRTGAILWDAPGGVVDIVGTTARHVVVQAAGDAAEPGGGSAPAVRLLAAATGRESARKAAGPGERPAGGGRLVGTMLFWPVHTGAPDRPVLRTLAVHVLDGDTLQPLAATTILPIGAPSAADDRETGDAEAVEIAVGSGVMLVASGRRIYCLYDGNRKAGPPSAE
jgi:outer membrane protein assembly factor BamB